MPVVPVCSTLSQRAAKLLRTYQACPSRLGWPVAQRMRRFQHLQIGSLLIKCNSHPAVPQTERLHLAWFRCSSYEARFSHARAISASTDMPSPSNAMFPSRNIAVRILPLAATLIERAAADVFRGAPWLPRCTQHQVICAPWQDPASPQLQSVATPVGYQQACCGHPLGKPYRGQNARPRWGVGGCSR